MTRYAIFVLVLGVLAGCVAGESAQSCRYDITMKLDSGQYDAAIAKLNDASCASAYSAAEREINLAAANLGKAGFDIPSLLNDVTSAGSTSTNSYAQFVSAVKKKATAASLDSLNTAGKHYDNVLSPQTVDKACTPAGAASLTTGQKDACFLAGIVRSATSSIGVVMLLGGDLNVDAWIRPQGCTQDANINGKSDLAESTSCALEIGNGRPCTSPGVTGTLSGAMQFKSSSGQLGTFKVATVTVAGVTPCAAATTDMIVTVPSATVPTSTVMLTDGYCEANTAQYKACTKGSSNCYPCPVVTADGSQTMTSAIVSMLTQSGPAIAAGLPPGQQGDVTTSINNFTTQACGSDLVCTDAEIAAYLAK